MEGYLSRSISSLNQNKLRGLLAEVEFRRYLNELGYGERVSPGGWIMRRQGPGVFGQDTVVVFPERIQADVDYPANRPLPTPPLGLHTICATFHQSGIYAFYCVGAVGNTDDPASLSWRSVQLGVPAEQPYNPLPESLAAYFNPRLRRYDFLRYHTAADSIPDSAVPEEFSKEHLRVTCQTAYMAEVSDVDGIFWGRQLTYPLEIKEKTAGSDRALGQFFGLDVGPFVKLAFYAANRGNLHSLFIVREIDNVQDRNLINWWYITFERLARYASWIPQAGGMSMMGGASSVVKIPKSEFEELNGAGLAAL
jgi:hypothetical protein